MSIELESAARLAALRDKANATTGENADTLAGAVDALIAGYGQGGESINLLDYTTFGNGKMFVGTKLPEDTRINIKINTFGTQTPNLSNQFAYITNLAFLRLDITNVDRQINMGSLANSTATLKEVEIVGDTSYITTLGSAFENCKALETINATLNLTGLTVDMSRTFVSCYNLKNIRFAEKSIAVNVSFDASQYLTGESIQSIIDGLADLTDGTTKTIKLHVNVKSNLTDDQILSITNKNWTLA